MIPTMNEYYKIGASLTAEHPSYVERKADNDLYKFAFLDDVHLGCVFAPRQMGKTSLTRRISNRLEKEKFICATIEISKSSDIKQEQNLSRFYKHLLKKICGELYTTQNEFLEGTDSLIFLQDKVDKFWQENFLFDNFIKFLEYFISQDFPLAKRAVFFIDEIQKLFRYRELSENIFSDFSSWGDSASKKNNRGKIKFVLLGTVNPYYFFREEAWNKAKNFALGNLEDDVSALCDGLKVVYEEDAEFILEQILLWTKGTPFLTQYICNAVFEGAIKGVSKKNISEKLDRFIQKEFVENWRSKSEEHQFHFDEIQRWFDGCGCYTDKHERIRALKLYDKIIKSNQAEAYIQKK
ncbi:MAG: AAA family ATPase, partial [Symploca sp. SIO3E6]|nr:AAA family ATPase [Caldora sp. SIO3E6]